MFKKLKIFIFILILMFASSEIIAKESNNSISLNSNKPIYFLLGKDKDKDIVSKFQISVRVNLIDNTCFNFGYTQKSFWDIGKKSGPFRESNYNPELFCKLEFKDNITHIINTQFGYEHESNGKDKKDSRSWERAYLKNDFKLTNYSELSLKFWYPFFLHENRDLLNYYGKWEHSIKFGTDNIEFKYTKRIKQEYYDFIIGGWISNVYFHVQKFNGYGESLIDYNKYEKWTRYGITFIK